MYKDTYIIITKDQSLLVFRKMGDIKYGSVILKGLSI